MTTPDRGHPRNGYEQVFPVLCQVYLEDSWVYAVEGSSDRLVFTLDAVVTPQFPDYHGPRPGEYYDCRRARLTVVGSQVRYEPSHRPPAQDATGTLDHGNIDAWTVGEDGWSSLEGEWGTAQVLDAQPELVFLEQEH